MLIRGHEAPPSPSQRSIGDMQPRHDCFQLVGGEEVPIHDRAADRVGDCHTASQFLLARALGWMS
ncbi:MAG: hypothetical protein DMF90_26850 [Acidobacteria bacterium]|nr:MAG: hypothetical protein DMF90_26850 [Acidobacteriota bacterium]